MSISTSQELLERGMPIEPCYDLAASEVADITSSFLSVQDTMVGRYACFRVAPDLPIANVARTVECEVFDAAFGNDAEAMMREYAPYEYASRFLLAVNLKDRMPAGVVRLVQYSESGLKSINDLGDPLGITEDTFKEQQGISNLSDCWDIGTLAVLPEYRGKKNRFAVSTMLYRGIFLAGVAEQTEHYITILDERARKGPDLLGIPLKEMVGTEVFSYLGSERSYAMHGFFPDFAESVAARSDELQRRAAITPGSILRPKELITNRIIAAIAGSLATGKGIDSNMRM